MKLSNLKETGSGLRAKALLTVRNPLQRLLGKLLKAAFEPLFKEKLARMDPALNSIQWPARGL